MTQFTVVAYRPNGLDTCRGCEMGRSDSAFDIRFFDNIQDTAYYIASKYIEDTKSDREFCNWELTVLVDGLDEDTWYNHYYEVKDRGNDIDDPRFWNQITVEVKIQIEKIKAVIEEKRLKKLEDIKQKEKLANEKALALQEEQERLQYLRLRQKYGSEF